MNKIHVNTSVNGDDLEFLCDPREVVVATPKIGTRGSEMY